ncbi:flavin reductase [Rhodospirillum sp. A1_3_36]|uniref:flavin reductase n=1 Tax=Rhodospirillum sp. A1_3_36 TaxID=3391666 RepID=UPI0039A4B8A4
MTVSQEEFRTAMSRLGAAVTLVTTDGSAGRHGITASAVCSVTDSPPTVLVCVNRASGAHQIFKDNGVFCVNVLAPDHRDLAMAFAGKLPPEERFAAEGWSALSSGAPVLEAATVALDCRLDQVTEAGTHSVLFGAVIGTRLAQEAEGLVYFNRDFHSLGSSAAPSSAS